MANVVDAKLIDRIRALMSRAKQGDNESSVDFESRQGEVATCMQKVQELLEKHNLDLFQIEGGEDKLKLDVEHLAVPAGKGSAFDKYASWPDFIARAVGMCTYTDALSSVDGRNIFFIGSKEDTQVAKELYTYIVDQMADMCRIERSRTGYEGGSSRYKKFTTNFMNGCASKVHTRILHWKHDSHKQSSTALVKITSERNQSYIKDVLKPISKPAPDRDHDPVAYLAGYYSGDHIKITKDKQLPE